MDWTTIEMLGYAYYSQQGYRVLVSLVRNDAYDFAIEKNGEFMKVNVKLAGRKDKAKGNSWCISLASGSKTNSCRSNAGHVDVYLAYLPHQDRFIELPGDFFSGKNSKSRLIPKHLLSTPTET